VPTASGLTALPDRLFTVILYRINVRYGFFTREFIGKGDSVMNPIEVGQMFPAGKLPDIDGKTVEFPSVFSSTPSTVVSFYRGRW
jgi:hypothetical protein